MKWLSCFYNVCVFAAVLSAMVMKRLGEWQAMAVGGLIMTFGLGLSVFATEIYHLYLTYGLITGVYIMFYYNIIHV